jgi:hypothetical protein
MQLHSEILARHCKFFQQAFQKHLGVELSSGAKKAGVTMRWRFDLALDGENRARQLRNEAEGKSSYADIGMLRFTVSLTLSETTRIFRGFWSDDCC